jgi:hypothetical protein
MEDERWGRAYLLVLGTLAALIIAFTVLTLAYR